MTEPNAVKNERNLLAFSPYMTRTGVLPEMPCDIVEMMRLSSNIAIPIEIAIEIMVNIHERLIPLTVPAKSDLGIVISSMPETVFSEDMIGAMAHTY